MSEKICTKCNDPKPLTEFHKDRNNPSGYRSCCKVCFKLNYQDKEVQHSYYVKWREKNYDDRIFRRALGFKN